MRHQNSSLEETVKVETAEAQSLYVEPQNVTGLPARVEKADNCQNAQWEIKRRFSLVVALRRDLARSRFKRTELKNRLKVAEDEQRRREKELQTSTALKTELGIRLNKQSKDTRALERELTDTKDQLTRLTAQRELVLVNMGKESDGMRDGITKSHEELSSSRSDRGSIEQPLREAEKNAEKLTDDVVQLRSQLQESHEKCSELEETVRRDAAEAQLLKQKNETLQRLYEETREMLFTSGHDLKETKKALEAATAELDKLQGPFYDVVKELNEVLELQSSERQATMETQKDQINGALDSMDDVHSDISQKLETTSSLTLSLQHSPSVMKDMETQRETLIGQSSEMQDRVKKQAEEIKKIEAELRKSYEILTERLRLETERTKDNDNKRAEAAVLLQAENSMLKEREQGPSVGLEDSERINHLRSSELQASTSRQTELESRLSKPVEDAKAPDRELADTKGQLDHGTILSEERRLELVSTQNQSNDIHNDITKVRRSARR